LVSRVESDECRTNLINHFCAFFFDQYGMCVPPNLLVPGQHTNNVSSLFMNGFVFPEIAEQRRQIPRIQRPEDELVPATLGFIILVHKDPEAVVQLIEALYRQFFSLEF